MSVNQLHDLDAFFVIFTLIDYKTHQPLLFVMYNVCQFVLVMNEFNNGIARRCIFISKIRLLISILGCSCIVVGWGFSGDGVEVLIIVCLVCLSLY